MRKYGTYIAQIYYYDPQSAGINLQSPQSATTPRRLTLKTLRSNPDTAAFQFRSSVRVGNSFNSLSLLSPEG